MQANHGLAALLVATLLSACASAQQTDPPVSRSIRAAPQSKAPQSKAPKTAVADAAIDPARVRALAAKAAPNDPAEQERLFEAFMQWRKSQQKR